MRRFGIAALLALAAVWLYAPVRELPFLHFDDGQYVTGNSRVLQGLDWEGVRWAFTTFLASNWHPLTWLSHMADVSLFGRGPAAPHVENAVLHGLCAALGFLALARLAGQDARAAAAALLFAVHPQHVESVAWVSERKDLLSRRSGSSRCGRGRAGRGAGAARRTGSRSARTRWGCESARARLGRRHPAARVTLVAPAHGEGGGAECGPVKLRRQG